MDSLSQNGHTKVAKILLEYGAQVDLQNSPGSELMTFNVCLTLCMKTIYCHRYVTQGCPDFTLLTSCTK